MICNGVSRRGLTLKNQWQQYAVSRLSIGRNWNRILWQYCSMTAAAYVYAEARAAAGRTGIMVSSGQLYESLREYEKDNYYLLSDDGKPVVPEKIGNAWAELEKNGEIQINEKTYRDLKAGINPNTGEQLAQNSVSGEHRSGINFTFSPEKSWT